MANLKIIMKAVLKKVPFFGAQYLIHSTCSTHVFIGWPMQIAGFVFLQRKWESDKRYMADVIDVRSKNIEVVEREYSHSSSIVDWERACKS